MIKSPLNFNRIQLLMTDVIERQSNDKQRRAYKIQ